MRYSLQSAKLVTVIILLFVLSCSDDESDPDDQNGDNQDPGAMVPETFQPISYLTDRGINQYLQVDLDENLIEDNTIDIDVQLGAPPSAPRRMGQEYLTIYNNDLEGLSVWRYELRTGNQFEGEDIYSLEGNEILRDIFNSRENIIIVVRDQDFFNTAVIIDIVALEVKKVQLGIGTVNIATTSETMVSFVSPGSAEYNLSTVDLTSGTLLQDLSFAEPIKVYLMEDQLLVFYQDDRFETYDLNGLNLTSTSTFDIPSFEIGLFKVEGEGRQVISEIVFAQPFPISSAPVVYDLDLLMEVAGGGTFFLDQLDILQGESPGASLVDFVVSLDPEIVAIGYNTPTATEDIYRLRYLDFEGEVITDVPLTNKPDHLFFK